MANPIKSAIVQKTIEGEIYDIMIQTDTDNILCNKDGVSLTKKLADLTYMVARALANNDDSSSVDSKITSATTELYTKIMNPVNKNSEAIKVIQNWLKNDDNKTAADIIKDISNINARIDSIGTGGGSGGGGYIASKTAPEDTSLLWLDTSNNTAVLKYYDVTNKKWNAVNAVWG